MSINFSNKVLKNGLTLEELQFSDEFKKLNSKQQNEVLSIFNDFASRTKVADSSQQAIADKKLDLDEQAAMLGYYKSLAGDDSFDTELTKKDYNKETKGYENLSEGKSFNALSNFMNVFKNILFGKNDNETTNVEFQDYNAILTTETENIKSRKIFSFLDSLVEINTKKENGVTYTSKKEYGGKFVGTSNISYEYQGKSSIPSKVKFNNKEYSLDKATGMYKDSDGLMYKLSDKGFLEGPIVSSKPTSLTNIEKMYNENTDAQKRFSTIIDDTYKKLVACNFDIDKYQYSDDDFVTKITASGDEFLVDTKLGANFKLKKDINNPSGYTHEVMFSDKNKELEQVIDIVYDKLKACGFDSSKIMLSEEESKLIKNIEPYSNRRHFSIELQNGAKYEFNLTINKDKINEYNIKYSLNDEEAYYKYTPSDNTYREFDQNEKIELLNNSCKRLIKEQEKIYSTPIFGNTARQIDSTYKNLLNEVQNLSEKIGFDKNTLLEIFYEDTIAKEFNDINVCIDFNNKINIFLDLAGIDSKEKEKLLSKRKEFGSDEDFASYIRNTLISENYNNSSFDGKLENYTDIVQSGYGNCWAVSGLQSLVMSDIGRDFVNEINQHNETTSESTFSSYSYSEEQMLDMRGIISPSSDKDALPVLLSIKSDEGAYTGGNLGDFTRDLFGSEKLVRTIKSSKGTLNFLKANMSALNNHTYLTQLGISGLDRKELELRSGDTFTANHAYSILSVDKDGVTVIDPNKPDKPIKVSFEEIESSGFVLEYANINECIRNYRNTHK